MDRRAFLAAVAAGWVVDAVMPARKPVRGKILGASHRAGHLLRDGGAPSGGSSPAERADVVIVGGGVSGLSAAWRLADTGLDVRVLELESFAGGTSSWGDDGSVPYPWGAHYLAAPNVEARAALRLLSDMGAVTGWDAAGRPIFDPRVLCHYPQERLFYDGTWHTGLAPADVLSPAERAELTRFLDFEHTMTDRIGSDGLAAFQIPVELSSRDPAFTELDSMTMAAWLDREGYRTPFVRWYIRYATLDDYGADPEDVSAWAGLHYFAARKLKSAELEGSHFLVWPEGNGRLVKALLERGRPKLTLGALAISVTPTKNGVEVAYLDVAENAVRRIEARGAILATPSFVTRRLFPPSIERGVPVRASSPWVVANLHVRRPVDPNLPWDSVIYGAKGLGYVHARHQLTELSERTVLTYYRAYGEADVAAARHALAAAPWETLANEVLLDLAAPHPHLIEELDRMDLMVWGHGMPRPRPGFLGPTPFAVPAALDERIAWGHVDQSGMALFEEAQARGVRAAEILAPKLGLSLGETWL
ncbi:MAG: FAD-dependent oxidoreductase [Polyangiaceae bacterium]|nr:FAD-dependent oxidoreductase [Polyangiaceae bacterium]